MTVNDVVQFTEDHKWVGCFGVIREVKFCGDDIRYMVGVPVPQKGFAFIYVMESEKAIEKIGTAILVLRDGEEDESN